jgi:phthalate 4,5-dioxygenase
MLSKEENELLTLTGPGTPAGDMIRRYWQPAGLSEELPPGGAPVPIRLLGEDLVLFRNDAGEVGLVGLHCAHRGADLSYGRLEDGGLRCIYHGWLYDIHGKCLEMPGEAPGSTFHERIQLASYPCFEKNGLILAYLGPGEPPQVPNYDFLTVPEDHVYVTKIFSECNYLQGNEGNIDLLHVSFLHYSQRDEVNRPGNAKSNGALCSQGAAPYREKVEARMVDVGLRVCKVRTVDDESNYIRVGTFVMPNSYAFPAGGLNWHVPIDDTHHWKYVVTMSIDNPIDRNDPTGGRSRLAPGPTYYPILNKSNRYGQERDAMRSEVYCGVPSRYFAAQDLCVTEGAGPIQDRTQENLAPNDAPIAASRQLLAAAIKDVREGRDPLGVIRDPAKNKLNIVATFGVIPANKPWYDHCQQLLKEGRGWVGNALAANFA